MQNDLITVREKESGGAESCRGKKNLPDEDIGGREEEWVNLGGRNSESRGGKMLNCVMGL